MTPRTVPVVCAKAPRRVVCVPAVREPVMLSTYPPKLANLWRCSFCGARVRVVA